MLRLWFLLHWLLRLHRWFLCRLLYLLLYLLLSRLLISLVGDWYFSAIWKCLDDVRQRVRILVPR